MSSFTPAIRPDLIEAIMAALNLSSEEWDALPPPVQIKLALFFSQWRSDL